MIVPLSVKDIPPSPTLHSHFFFFFLFVLESLPFLRKCATSLIFMGNFHNLEPYFFISVAENMSKLSVYIMAALNKEKVVDFNFSFFYAHA